MYNGCILPREQSSFLWYLSWGALISFLFAVYRGHYDLMIVPGGVFLTSINYWRRPDYSWRRYVDMAVVQTSVVYQTWHAYTYRAQYATPYFFFVICAVMMFPVGIYYHKNDTHWISTGCHAMVHVFGNTANIVLYSGYVRQ